MAETLLEVNFDGLVGPSHNYAGLSRGNLASKRNQGRSSSPRKAAQQGLRKMKALMDRGARQCVIPPQLRPRLDVLEALGCKRDNAFEVSNDLTLARVYSASSMWAANAATVFPSTDTEDARMHIIVANLADRAHRSLEAAATQRYFERVFHDTTRFAVHAALPLGKIYSDEGAANHTRLVGSEGAFHLFAYGRSEHDGDATAMPARQTLEASLCVQRLAALRVRSSFVRQNSVAIEAGVFHNDVICVGHEDRLVWHAQAFADAPHLPQGLRTDIVQTSELSLEDAVRSYLFNSQLVRTDRGMELLAPSECDTPRIHAIFRRWQDRGIVDHIELMDLRESMQNGGGPACLRLRTPMTSSEWNAMHAGVQLTDFLFEQLWHWTGKLRDRVEPNDLGDPEFARECIERHDEVHALLGLA